MNEKVEGRKDMYAESGVDMQGADEGLRRLIKNIQTTWPKSGEDGEVKLEIGYFANVVRVGDMGIALCTDGIGSKAIIAQMLEKYDTVGIDCVAMNVNDLICVGATPRSMVDYIAVETANPVMLEELSKGLVVGAKQAGVSISGGEISQLKDIIVGVKQGFAFDFVGMAVGDVALDKVNCGEHVKPGDIVIGIESSGIHSNGLTLARKVLFEHGNFSVESAVSELDTTIGLELLKPTHIYVKEVLELLEKCDVKSLANITSDGFLNLTRIKSAVGFVLDNLPEPLPIFKLIQATGKVPNSEMFKVFNMGIGFCVVVNREEAEKALAIIASHGKKAWKIGVVAEDSTRTVSLPQFNLAGVDEFTEINGKP